MLKATLIPAESDYKIIDPITFYTQQNNYFCSVTNIDDTPFETVPVVIEAGRLPMHGYQHAYMNRIDLSDPTLNRHLMALKSKLSYGVREHIAGDKFYFDFINRSNDTYTRRDLTYKLYFSSIECHVLPSDPLLDKLAEIAAMDVGPLIFTSATLRIDGLPRWYIEGTFKDLIDNGSVDMEDKVLITGENTGGLYIFYREETNLTDEMLDSFTEKIKEDIIELSRLHVLPTNTPEEILLSLGITVGRTFSYEVPEHLSPYNEMHCQTFILKDIGRLMWFLIWLQLTPTYTFIEKELRISVEESGIKVEHDTKYLPDAIRINSASHVDIEDLNVEIFYNDVRPDLPDDKFYIRFYDHGKNSYAYLVRTTIEGMPSLVTESPVDYTLTTRVETDNRVLR